MIYRSIAFLIVISVFVACTREPESDHAKTGEALITDSVEYGTKYIIDTTSSIITWVGTKPTGRHNGIFKIKEGFFTTNETTENEKEENKPIEDNQQITSTRIIIDIASVDILDLKHDPEQYRKLLDHLHSRDFFYTREFPEAVFELISMERLKPDSVQRSSNEFVIIDPTHRVTGNLTLRGITKSIELPVKIGIRNQKLEASAKFNINRTAWNISYMNERDPVARAKDSFINNTVNIGFEIIAFSRTH